MMETIPNSNIVGMKTTLSTFLRFKIVILLSLLKMGCLTTKKHTCTIGQLTTCTSALL
ncbi:hypothetical protein [Latilactobacillus fuchuensis]|uniref:hypothetical protein n=1 Tax=Latilactobacillus fuchuensis TaxID=164393 RepID=UPI0039AFF2B1